MRTKITFTASLVIDMEPGAVIRLGAILDNTRKELADGNRAQLISPTWKRIAELLPPGHNVEFGVHTIIGEILSYAIANHLPSAIIADDTQVTGIKVAYAPTPDRLPPPADAVPQIIDKRVPALSDSACGSGCGCPPDYCAAEVNSKGLSTDAAGPCTEL